MTDPLEKTGLPEFTRSEFTDFVDAIGTSSQATEAEANRWIIHWDSINPHPEKSDLMYWPADGKARTSEEIVAEIERYCLENDLPAFSDSARTAGA